MRPDFLNVKVGDVVAVNQPNEKPYLAQVLLLKVCARFSDPNFLQVCREPDCAVMNICPSWITGRGPEPEPQDLSRQPEPDLASAGMPGFLHVARCASNHASLIVQRSFFVFGVVGGRTHCAIHHQLEPHPNLCAGVAHAGLSKQLTLRAIASKH